MAPEPAVEAVVETYCASHSSYRTQVAGIDHEGVPVSRSVQAAFDGRGRAERVRAPVALVRVLEAQVDEGLRLGVDDRPRDPVRIAAFIGTEVRMEVRGGGVHVRHPGRAVLVDRKIGDVGVPDVVGREHLALRCAGHRRAPRCCRRGTAAAAVAVSCDRSRSRGSTGGTQWRQPVPDGDAGAIGESGPSSEYRPSRSGLERFLRAPAGEPYGRPARRDPMIGRIRETDPADRPIPSPTS